MITHDKRILGKYMFKVIKKNTTIIVMSVVQRVPKLTVTTPTRRQLTSFWSLIVKLEQIQHDI